MSANLPYRGANAAGRTENSRLNGIVPKVTICVLTYGDYAELARQSIESIRLCSRRAEYRLVVGANAVSNATRDYLQDLAQRGEIDRLVISDVNINKNPMMRRMFEQIETEFVWWFDDDSYIEKEGALSTWLQIAEKSPASTVMWGQMAWCGTGAAFADIDDPIDWVRQANWYRGLSPPSWRIGGKGEINFRNLGIGDGRWIFLLGGCWLIRASAVRALDWPDPRLIKLGDDVLLGEAIRQQGWDCAHNGSPGVAINTKARRGSPGCFNESQTPLYQ
jgi:GT2 family glycosyltransferase